jgi:hypothetical protein
VRRSSTALRPFCEFSVREVLRPGGWERLAG